MKVLATVLLMMSLLAMSVAVASADITRPSCSAQIRADDMCYAAALPGGTAETGQKPGFCFICLAPVDGVGDLPRPGTTIHAEAGPALRGDALWVAPWRPPRA